VVETYLAAHRSLAPRRLELPRIIGMEGNPGLP